MAAGDDGDHGEMQGTGKISTTILAACLWATAAPADEVYRYTDADGIIHYTNIRPEGLRDYTTFTFPCYASDPKCREVDWEQVPLNTTAFREEIRRAANRYAVDESLIRAVIHAESAYLPDAESPKGAQGLMQLMPEIQTELRIENPYDPESNIGGGARYLARMLSEFEGDLELAAAAYNAGPTAVRNHAGVPPFPETREYVRRVKILYRRYRQSGA
jgi:soluble lytic murein transglycosylase-like protein